MKLKKNIPTFFFYDYETFGTNPFLDRPAQFAGIRTDMNFNIIEDEKKIYCKPPIDYLPSPESVIINEITPQKAIKKGVCEAYFSEYINNIFTTPNTCIIGYNNINFDDEFTRNIFYRNFFDPYDWCWKNNNSRWDLINIMRACYLLRPKGIKWVINKNNNPIFNLEKLTKKNKLKHENKHDAMSDVYATLRLAKLVKNHQPKLLNYLFKHRKKNNLISLIKIKDMQPLLYISHIFSSKRHNASLVLPIVWHPVYKNTVIIVYDLNTDLSQINNFINLQKNNLENFFKVYDKYHPIKFIYLNKCPILIPLSCLSIKDILNTNLNIELCKNNLSLIRKNFFKLQKKIFYLYYEHSKIIKCNISSNNVDTKLYESFFNNEDKLLFEKIKKNKFKKNNFINFDLYNNRIKSLLFNYRARNFPKTLNKLERNIWMNRCKSIFNEDKIKYYLNNLKDLSYQYKNKKKIIQKMFEYVYKLSKIINFKID